MEEARNWSIDSIEDISIGQVEDALKNLLSHPTIASKRWVWQQYDHMVMSGCKIEPGSDAGVVRLSIAESISTWQSPMTVIIDSANLIHIKVLKSPL